MPDLRRELAAATEQYRATEAAHAAARATLRKAVVAALQGGLTPTEVERLSPFTGAHIRALARAEGIPPAPPGPKTGRRRGRPGPVVHDVNETK